MTILFESEELTLGYANQIVISKLSLCVNHPSNVEIIGNNGSGKSTLISCISGNFTGNSFNSIIKKSENFDFQDTLFTIDNTRLMISKKIKESFDPKKLFNPGRMYREL